MVPARFGPALHSKLPGARFKWLDEASHFAHVDAVDRVLDHVLPFFQAGDA